MQKEFEEAAFKLQPGSMSGIVQTASGLHLIERYSTRSNFKVSIHTTYSLLGLLDYQKCISIQLLTTDSGQVFYQ